MENANEIAQLAVRPAAARRCCDRCIWNASTATAAAGALMLPWTAELCTDVAEGVLYEAGESDEDQAWCRTAG